MKLSIVVSTQPAQFSAVAFKGDLAGHFEHIARLGYDGVELAVRDPALVDAKGIEALLARHGLVVSAIGTGQAWGEERLSLTDARVEVRAAALTRLKSHLPLAARFGAPVIVGLIRGVTPTGESRDHVMKWLVEALRECARIAAPLGVGLAVEPINRYETDLINTIEDGLALLDGVGAENVGLLADTFHMNIEEPSIEAGLRRAGPRLRHVHVADSNRRYPGAGHLDFERLITVLKDEVGYHGWLSAEIIPEPDALIAAERAVRVLRQWIK